jgi:hypothetical protein
MPAKDIHHFDQCAQIRQIASPPERADDRPGT